MPDTKEKTEVTEQPPVAKKSLLPANLASTLTKVAIFGLIGLVAVFAAYLLTLKVLKPMMAHEAPTEQQAAAAKAESVKAEPVKAEKQEEAPAGHGESEASGSEQGGSNKFFAVESIVVNPAETQGTRYLSCSVSFEVATQEDLKAFEEKSVKIKDLLITILSSKTVDELADIKIRNDMRRQILVVVNRFTTPAQATAVYLTDFVLQ